MNKCAESNIYSLCDFNEFYALATSVGRKTMSKCCNG